ncbi:hypothetical protein GGX14DRAFT_602799 [Mycena pura]|uniref:Uncharacterized protein n=1 Tax=Mycena pura TaxID=153505 RepID=A0AAD6VMB0_9AGAR|nr:hypothetical protein GGX14DRAFT_602799 [Mycena pura]
MTSTSSANTANAGPSAHPVPSLCDPLASKFAEQSGIAGVLEQTNDIVKTIGSAILRSLPNNLRDIESLKKLVDKADKAMVDISTASFPYGWEYLMVQLAAEVEAAKTGLERLDKSGWGPSATHEFLFSVRHEIGGVVAVVKLLSLVSKLEGDPTAPPTRPDPKGSRKRVENSVSSTIRRIDDGVEPAKRDGPVAGLIATVFGAFAEVAKSFTAFNIMSVVLPRRIQLVKHLLKILEASPEDKPLTRAVKEETGQLRGNLERLQKLLNYENAASSVGEFRALTQEFDDACDGILVCFVECPFYKN